MAAGSAAEQLHKENQISQPTEVVPLVKLVTAMPQETLVRARAESIIRKIGDIALRAKQQPEAKTKNRPRNLLEALKRTNLGDSVARQMALANIGSDVLERTIKVGLILEAEMDEDEDGNFSQHGQTSQEIQENSLLYASDTWQMRGRSEAELRNSLRIPILYRLGYLKDHTYVVLSRTADNMTEKERQDAGFFDSLPFVIQATGVKKGGVKMESAFVAGISAPGKKPHDQQTLIELGKYFGIDLSGLSATELIDTPLLVPNSLMPNGVIDLVKICDILAGGTFFGEDRPVQDYLQFKQQCKARAESYAPKIQLICGEMLAKVDALGDDPSDAVRLLSSLSQRHMVEQSVYDNRIDPMVFGPAAAHHIVQARIHDALGNTQLARASIDRAQLVAKSNSCPSGLLNLLERAVGQTEQSTDQSGEQTWHGGKKYYNAKCNSCKKIKHEVGACRICKDCVLNPPRIQTEEIKEKEDQSVADAIIIGLVSKKAKLNSKDKAKERLIAA